MKRADQAYKFIKEKILSQQWLPGQAIKEVQLAKLLDMSRTPIRRAFVHLEEEGLIDAAANKGVVVAERKLSKKEFKHAVDFFELMALHYLQQLQTKEYDYPIADLLACLDRMDQLASQEDVDFIQAEADFWREFLHQSANDYNTAMMLSTMNLLLKQKGEIASIMAQSRSSKLEHLHTFLVYLDDNDYPYARRELRILFNQMVLNIFQGPEGTPF